MRYRYATSLNWGGDEPTAEMDVDVTFDVAWGTPATGLSGPPENYDPGCGDVIEDVRVEKINNQSVADYTRYEFEPGGTVREILDKLENEHEEAMLLEAHEHEGAAEAEAFERLREDLSEAG